jgi:RecA-family ATPase
MNVEPGFLHTLTPEDLRRAAGGPAECVRAEEPPPWGEAADHGTRPLRRNLEAPPVRLPDPQNLVATEEELAAAELHPRCVVEFHSYADVAVLAAAGGAGKSTLMLYEAIHIAIGRPLYGLPVVNPGWTLFVAAEDRRPQILARLREVMRPLDLAAEERRAVLSAVRVWDVTGESVKLIRASDGNMVLTDLADAIVGACAAGPPAVVIFDPLVSFGASEEAVNSNEQGLITSARRIVRGLDCCVRLIHHTGKANGRAGTLDQYSARGGSALSDGARMVSVLAPWTAEDEGGGPQPPPGCSEEHGAALIRYARAKLSYCPPQPMIWLSRRGFAFEYFIEPPKMAPEAIRSAQADQLARYIASQLAAGRFHTGRSLEDCAEDLGLSRAKVRRALAELRASGRIFDEELPAELRRGVRKTYLHCANADGAIVAKNGRESFPEEPIAPAAYCSPPLREKEDGAIDAAFSSPLFPDCAGEQRRNSGAMAQCPEEAVEEVPGATPEEIRERYPNAAARPLDEAEWGEALARMAAPAAPGPVRCRECAHWIPDEIHPAGGLGSCAVEAPASRRAGSLWPGAELYCGAGRHGPGGPARPLEAPAGEGKGHLPGAPSREAS